ncbi:MAG: hypothetical protein WC547_02670 [Candidatus Omnitrophota bacterium]
MDPNECVRLKQQYEQYADAQILSMLEDGPDAFVAGAYALLEEEALRRGISLKSEDPVPEHGAPQTQESSWGEPIHPEAFVEIMVIDRDDDQRSVASRLESTDIPFHFMNISVAGKEFPVALMVDQRRIEEAVGQLRQLPLEGSIVLW